jgi:dolichol-phosphate mannosyltransferase
MKAELSVVVPVYNEGENIQRTLAELSAKAGGLLNEVLLVYDFPEDNTLPAAQQVSGQFPFPIRLVRNAFGRGALNAIRTGFQEAAGPAVLLCMADLSDDLIAVPAMYEHIREGCDVVCGSRYMRGGRQRGGPFLKRTFSRLAGVSLYWLAGLPTHDVTNSFKMYRKAMLDRLTIESSGGFEIGMEIVVKTFALGGKIGEVPCTWTDRAAGESRFRMWKWMPNYLRWYWFALKSRFRRPRRTDFSPSNK